MQILNLKSKTLKLKSKFGLAQPFEVFCVCAQDRSESGETNLLPQGLMPRSQRAGFTLVELLVAIGLFSIVVIIAIGGFARALRTERQARFLLATNSNASIVMEVIARELRTASSGSMKIIESGRGIDFVNSYGQNVVYKLDDGAISKQEGLEVFTISSDKTSISGLTFYLQNLSMSDGYPKRVTVSFSASPSSTDTAVSGSKVDLETTISVRLMDDRPPTLIVQNIVCNTPTDGTAEPDSFKILVKADKIRPCPKDASYPDECVLTGNQIVRNVGGCPRNSTGDMTSYIVTLAEMLGSKKYVVRNDADLGRGYKPMYITFDPGNRTYKQSFTSCTDNIVVNESDTCTIINTPIPGSR